MDPKVLKRDQIINHYGKAGTFTTKVSKNIYDILFKYLLTTGIWSYQYKFSSDTEEGLFF